jgi:hypothetical protein
MRVLLDKSLNLVEVRLEESVMVAAHNWNNQAASKLEWSR